VDYIKKFAFLGSLQAKRSLADGQPGCRISQIRPFQNFSFWEWLRILAFLICRNSMWGHFPALCDAALVNIQPAAAFIAQGIGAEIPEAPQGLRNWSG
jgi:hypothetical protein